MLLGNTAILVCCFLVLKLHQAYACCGNCCGRPVGQPTIIHMPGPPMAPLAQQSNNKEPSVLVLPINIGGPAPLMHNPPLGHPPVVEIPVPVPHAVPVHIPIYGPEHQPVHVMPGPLIEHHIPPPHIIEAHNPVDIHVPAGHVAEIHPFNSHPGHPGFVPLHPIHPLDVLPVHPHDIFPVHPHDIFPVHPHDVLPPLVHPADVHPSVHNPLPPLSASPGGGQFIGPQLPPGQVPPLEPQLPPPPPLDPLPSDIHPMNEPLPGQVYPGQISPQPYPPLQNPNLPPPFPQGEPFPPLPPIPQGELPPQVSPLAPAHANKFAVSHRSGTAEAYRIAQAKQQTANGAKLRDTAVKQKKTRTMQPAKITINILSEAEAQARRRKPGLESNDSPLPAASFMRFPPRAKSFTSSIDQKNSSPGIQSSYFAASNNNGKRQDIKQAASADYMPTAELPAPAPKRFTNVHTSLSRNPVPKAISEAKPKTAGRPFSKHWTVVTEVATAEQRPIAEYNQEFPSMFKRPSRLELAEALAATTTRGPAGLPVPKLAFAKDSGTIRNPKNAAGHHYLPLAKRPPLGKGKPPRNATNAREPVEVSVSKADPDIASLLMLKLAMEKRPTIVGINANESLHIVYVPVFCNSTGNAQPKLVGNKPAHKIAPALMDRESPENATRKRPDDGRLPKVKGNRPGINKRPQPGIVVEPELIWSRIPAPRGIKKAAKAHHGSNVSRPSDSPTKPQLDHETTDEAPANQSIPALPPISRKRISIKVNSTGSTTTKKSIETTTATSKPSSSVSTTTSTVSTSATTSTTIATTKNRSTKPKTRKPTSRKIKTTTVATATATTMTAPPALEANLGTDESSSKDDSLLSTNVKKDPGAGSSSGDSNETNEKPDTKAFEEEPDVSLKSEEEEENMEENEDET